MATLTRSNSRAAPSYKEYMHFLGNYKNGKSENLPETNNPAHSDFSKSAMSFNAYIEHLKSKKFNTVDPNLEPKADSDTTDFARSDNVVPKSAKTDPEKAVKKSEIFIEVQATKPVSEVSKMFEKKQNKAPPKSTRMNSKINIFEKQISQEKPKLAEKPVIEVKKQNVTLPPPPPPLIPKAETAIKKQNVTCPPPPPPLIPKAETEIKKQNVTCPPPPQAAAVHSEASSPPPPPPMPVIIPPAKMSAAHTLPKMQATLVKGPQIKHSVATSPNGVVPNEIDRNNPMVRKLVYGTLRGLYGAYHDKANDMMATLPKNAVKKSNGVQDIIEKIASNGDLEKLNGRINPKLDQE